MTLNKTPGYVLLHLLNGSVNARAIAERMPHRTPRSIQRSLSRLCEMGLVSKLGSKNNPTYETNYPGLVNQVIPDKLLEDENRPNTHFNHGLIGWLNSLQPKKLDQLIDNSPNLPSTTKMSPKELEYLTIELSWKSSALEGNTYTLLDTQLLLTEGIKAKNRTEFETQMILNHKNAISFIIQNLELFGDQLKFSTVDKLHQIIGYNLSIDSHIRKKLARISASNYEPMANPHQLIENGDRLLGIINRATSPFIKALLALALIPYLQAFEDGNKRTGRMLANGLLLQAIGRGFSLRKVDARELALAYLSCYEYNSLKALSDLLKQELT